jgi:hypothetical protein
MWCQQRTFPQENGPHTGGKVQDGSKKEERVGYAVIWNQQEITKRVWPKNIIYSAEQSAIITAIHSTMKEPGKKVITTDSLGILVAASDKKNTKNPKTQTIRKLLEQEGANLTLLWVLSHVGIPGNENLEKVVPPVGLSEIDNPTTRRTTTKKMRTD